MSADPSAAARRAAQAYLREILQRAPFPPDIDRVARAIDAAYKRIYPTRNGAEGAGERASTTPRRLDLAPRAAAQPAVAQAQR